MVRARSVPDGPVRTGEWRGLAGPDALTVLVRRSPGRTAVGDPSWQCGGQLAW
jgi:hypothetical protein